MDMEALLRQQQLFFRECNTLSYGFRVEALRRLSKSIREHEKQITQALHDDLHKSEFESYATEIGFVLNEIDYAIGHLKVWMRPRKASTSLMFFGSRSEIMSQPLGVVLILSPWNYPFQLLLSPLVGAIAAGNCAILKPSTQTPRVNIELKKIIETAFDPQYIAFADVPNDQVDRLLSLKFDHIFYTGGVEYGRHVLRMAAENLIPVTLELGGKSPCVVDRDADLRIAARRIVWGKLINAGQTCVAPDYVMVHQDVRSQFVGLLKAEIARQYGSDPKESPDYPRVISQQHCQRLQALMNGGTVVEGGAVDVMQKYVAPTIITDVDIHSPLMTEEIFGPLLPVVEFIDIEEVISFINTREKPLALYYFSQNTTHAEKFLARTTSGGACINDVVVHVANNRLPFGGVGNSGMGNYHGAYGFETFSHKRAVVTTTTLFNIGVKFAPYKSKIRFLRKLM